MHSPIDKRTTFLYFRPMQTKTNETSETLNAIAMSREVLSNSQDINNVLTTSQQVKAVFHTHFADMETGECGIENLIARILREREAQFPKGVESTELRQIAVAGAMFTDEIVTEVQNRFTAGSVRYPKQTVKAYLSVFMAKSGKIGRIQLTNSEDKNRTCCKPRCKWYLVTE
jgi:hypothetical protein